jgi:hypothetical protein
MVIMMVVGVDVIVVAGVVVELAADEIVIVGVGVLVVGLGIIPGVIVTVGAALNVPQAERTTAAEQNKKQSFINIGASREISDFWRGISRNLHSNCRHGIRCFE